jgi:hypothetical protein
LGIEKEKKDFENDIYKEENIVNIKQEDNIITFVYEEKQNEESEIQIKEEEKDIYNEEREIKIKQEDNIIKFIYEDEDESEKKEIKREDFLIKNEKAKIKIKNQMGNLEIYEDLKAHQYVLINVDKLLEIPKMKILKV